MYNPLDIEFLGSPTLQQTHVSQRLRHFTAAQPAAQPHKDDKRKMQVGSCATITGSAGRGLGLGLIYELASSPTACTSAAAAVSAAILYRPVATCSESTSPTVQDDALPHDDPVHQSGRAAGAGFAAAGYRVDGTPRVIQSVLSLPYPSRSVAHVAACIFVIQLRRNTVMRRCPRIFGHVAR